nr:DUF3363 domain-containing protein [Sphingomonas sp. BT-65]
MLRAAGKAGPLRPPQRRRASAARLARGAIAARLVGSQLGRQARRVVIKTRLMVLADAGARSTITHLAYLERDAVGPNGERGHAYGRDAEQIDTGDFEARGRGDRHQFRIIVAPEDGAALGDLKAFTRGLMARMEADLGTRLDWVAVDHHETANPHSHVVLRGVDQAGADLVIARDYIAHGMRMRASGLATEWLGPRTEREIAQALDRDAVADRWTGLDRALVRAAGSEREVTPSGPLRSAQGRRLHHLETLGLAEPVGRGRWRLAAQLEPTLRALGERGDIVRTMQRAFGAGQRALVLPGEDEAQGAVTGCIAAKGLADELGDQGYLVIDGVDGRAHYARLPRGSDLAAWPVGGIVELHRAGAADRTIAAVAEDGIYSVARHRARAASERNPDGFVAAHVRRLEALRRAGLAERLDGDRWRVPPDFVARGAAHDRTQDVAPRLRSTLPLDAQVRAIGATWLDQTLVEGRDRLALGGFGAEVRDALGRREAVLEREGLARRANGRLILARDLLAQLRVRDLDAAARTIAADTGLAYRGAAHGAVAGTYVGAVDRPSGRFAMLDDGAGGFALVPWRPVIEQRLGQWISGVARGSEISWNLGRTRGIGP